MATDVRPYEPLTSENATLVLIDHQIGLMTGVRDYSTGELKHNVVGLAKAAKALKLPIVVTTTARDSMWGPRALVIEPKSCGVLDTPLSRSMTTSCEARLFESRIRYPTTTRNDRWSTRYRNTIHAGAWSLAPSSPRTVRSTPAFVSRGESTGLTSRWSSRRPASRGQRLRL